MTLCTKRELYLRRVTYQFVQVIALNENNFHYRLHFVPNSFIIVQYQLFILIFNLSKSIPLFTLLARLRGIRLRDEILSYFSQSVRVTV